MEKKRKMSIATKRSYELDPTSKIRMSKALKKYYKTHTVWNKGLSKEQQKQYIIKKKKKG
jgi:hypothetical protein